MAPPPSTPAPHRFLVPKRSAAKRTETTPSAPAAAPQFRATPRFSLHSTPRPTAPPLPSSTPARPSTFRRQRNADDISDAIDSSPPAPLPSTRNLLDCIEDSSTLASSAVVADHDQLQSDASDDETAAPSPKRRRLTVSPILDPASSFLSGTEESMAEDERFPEECDDEEDGVVSDSQELPDLPSVHQPTFQKAPRFMPVEQSLVPGREPLPDVFSPHRRGARYVPGGLAAELRDWVLDIEATTGPKRDDDFLTRIAVDEVRHGTGMILTTGRSVPDDGLPPAQDDASPSVRVMLAGDGRLIGLARRPEVVVGSTVGIARPVWEVNLGAEGRWAVACDWVVL